MIIVMHVHTPPEPPESALATLPAWLRQWAPEFGFEALGISRAEIPAERATALLQWLAEGRHGGMDYMARHATLRLDPRELLPGTLSLISARMSYAPDAADAEAQLAKPQGAYISRYAMGRDYHKLLRQRLQGLATRLTDFTQTIADLPAVYTRVCTDSAPVMEVEFARQAGLGWRGKHTLLLNQTGSWHFIGEILTTLPLPPDAPVSDHCGRCTRCIDICPTQAIIAPYQVDARRCISYLTIEHVGAIPETLRPLIGNRIYGCDDCQLACPWNRFAQRTRIPDFAPRNGLDHAGLIELFSWSEATFLDRLAGSPIRRIGHTRWLRNLAVALGNAPVTPAVRQALAGRADDPSPLIREHVAWALTRQTPTA